MSNDSFSMDGKVAVVTGAAGGMGEAITRTLVEAGARVVACDRAAEPLRALAGSLGDAVADVAGDITDPELVRLMVATAVDRFGRLDAAVNAAAVEFEKVPLHLTTDDDFETMMQINVSALFRCMRAELNVMLDAGNGGSIVNIASTNSFRPQPNQPAYTASKHAVLGLTRSAALDYAADGIRVNAICPGTIDTPMLRNAIERRGRDPQEVAKRLSRFGRFGTPQEIADACLWLCSGASSFTTGHALAVDGGMLGA
jgi:NAD(P)-dependent dehydrogenase (short-subunit alcohol dehydrogenase family)